MLVLPHRYALSALFDCDYAEKAILVCRSSSAMEVEHHDTGQAGGPAAQSQRARTTHNEPAARERHVASASYMCLFPNATFILA